MDFIKTLFEGSQAYWAGGVSHSIFILALVITLGLVLGKIKVKNVSLGLTWVLIVGIVFGYFNLNLNVELLHFLREFGLVLFVYSLGLQVGPGFFASFKKGGLQLNILVLITILISILTAWGVYCFTDTPFTAIAGILSGAVTNTPGMGAAQQAFFSMKGVESPDIATGYALAYPLGVIGVILSFITLRLILRIKPGEEEEQAKTGEGQPELLAVRSVSLEITNERIDNLTVAEVKHIVGRHFMISRVIDHGNTSHNAIVNGQTRLRLNDIVLVVVAPQDVDSLIALFGKQVSVSLSHVASS